MKKSDIQVKLDAYIANPTGIYENYNLAEEYYNLGQTAAAVSYYLRTAEYADFLLRNQSVEPDDMLSDITKKSDLVYTCLVKIAFCFDKQGDRDNSVRCMYKKAIHYKPNRPEAYFHLSRHYEVRQEYIDAYTYAILGINNDSGWLSDASNLDLQYPGSYGLLFQKAVSAWWIGNPQECRSLFRILGFMYGHKLNQVHYNAVQENLTRLGIGPESQAFIRYSAKKHSQLRHKFNGYEMIENNYSQVYQDMFVLTMFDGKTHGTYLEIGSGDPFHGNNTALLEQKYFWSGIGIEYNKSLADKYTASRKNPVLCRDAREINYDELLAGIANQNGMIDYLQLDCEPSAVTYEIMTKIAFDKYKFGVITYEHDDYVDMTRKYKALSREFLSSKGYILALPDVSPDGQSSFEDWWVHPDVCNTQSSLITDILKSKTKINIPEKDFFLKKTEAQHDILQTG